MAPLRGIEILGLAHVVEPIFYHPQKTLSWNGGTPIVSASRLKTQNYSTPERILVWDLFAKYESTFVLAVGGKGYHLFGLVYNL